MKHYHNTTNESGEILTRYEKQAMTQDNRIALFFEINAGELFTPWEVQSLAFRIGPDRPPITSIRRAMSNLTKAGILTKTEVLKQVGHYGRSSYAWTLNEKYRETLGIMEDIDQEPPKEAKDEPMSEELYEYIDKEVRDSEGLNEASKDPQQLTFDGMIPPRDDLNVLKCGICGRPLADPRSIKRGVGPVCFGKCKERGQV